MGKKRPKIDTAKIIDKMVEDKIYITRMIREDKIEELKSQFKFAKPL